METQPLPVGTQLDNRYTITQLVAGGGMAWIYRAREEGSRAIWAIKELRSPGSPATSSGRGSGRRSGQTSELTESAERAQARRLFQQEAQLLATLRHRNLPRVAGAFEQDGRSYLVMEFVVGESLQKRLKEANAPLLESEVVDWALQICDVLGYLHSQTPPVIFRDLKPSNMMVTPDGTVKLIDFGIARTYKAGKLRDTIAMGSENYAAPEQWGMAQTDARSDIYALGATMYHLLANTPPSPAFLPAPPVPLRQYNPAVSERTTGAIKRAMARDPDQRFATAAAMRSALTGGQDKAVRRTGAASPPRILEKSCPDCGTSNRAAARFCRRCGHSFVGLLPARLRFLRPSAVAWEMPVQGPMMLIGRRSEPEDLIPDLDLAFYDPDAHVSRRHAIIRRNGRQYEIADLGSDNGTWVNNAAVAAGKPRPLRNGDQIQVGRIVLEFRIES